MTWPRRISWPWPSWWTSRFSISSRRPIIRARRSPTGRTMDDLQVPQRGRFVLSWAYHPRALPLAVPAAAVHMAAMRGMEVVVLRPEGFALPPAVMTKARQAATQSGGSVRETADRRDALEGAHVIYAKEWGSTSCYGRRRRGCQTARRAPGMVCQERLVYEYGTGLPPHALSTRETQHRRRRRSSRQPAQHCATRALTDWSCRRPCFIKC